MVSAMGTITLPTEIKERDEFTLEDNLRGEIEGVVIHSENGRVLARVYEGADSFLKVINTKQIISLKRGKDYFKVSIK